MHIYVCMNATRVVNRFGSNTSDALFGIWADLWRFVCWRLSQGNIYDHSKTSCFCARMCAEPLRSWVMSHPPSPSAWFMSDSADLRSEAVSEPVSLRRNSAQQTQKSLPWNEYKNHLQACGWCMNIKCICAVINAKYLPLDAGSLVTKSYILASFKGEAAFACWVLAVYEMFALQFLFV